MKTPIVNPSTRPFCWRSRILALATLLPWLTAEFAPAATRTWDGSSSAFWNTAANWVENAVPTDGDDLVFPAGPTRLATTNNTSATRRYRSITITGVNYALRGNSLTLSNGITATYGAGATAWVELDVSLARSQEIECTTDNSNLYVTGDLALGAATLTVSGSGNVLLGGALSGTGGCTKNGLGTLRFYGSTDNTHTGVTRVNSGTLELNKDGANAIRGDLIVGNDTGTDTARWLRGSQVLSTTDVTVNDGAILDLNGYSEALGALTLNGGTARTGSGLLTLGGNVTARPGLVTGFGVEISGRLGLGSSTRTFTVIPDGATVWIILEVLAEVSGSGGLVKSGSGAMALKGANTYGGLTTVNEGALVVLSDNALGSATAGTIIQAGAGLELAAAYTNSIHVGTESLTLSGYLWSGAAGFDTSNSWAGPITLLTNANILVEENDFLNLSGSVQGTGGFTKNRTGTLLLSGSQANTFTGDVQVNSGTLLLGKTVTDGALPGPGALIVGDGAGGTKADVVSELRSFQIETTVNIAVNDSGLLDLNGFSDTVGALTLIGGQVETGAGRLTLGGNLTASSTAFNPAVRGSLGLGAVTRTVDVTGQLWIEASVTGTGGFRKTGTGELYLTAANTFSGVATVAEGVLLLEDDQALGSAADGTVVETGAALVLGLNAPVQISAESLTLNGPGSGSVATLMSGWLSLPLSNSWAGPITLATDVEIEVRIGLLELAGAISGPGGFTKSGYGSLLLSGSAGNTHNGNTRITQGELFLGKTAGSGVAIRYGTLFIGDGVGGASSDLVRYTANNQLWSTVSIVITNSGWLDLNGFTDTIGPLTLASGRASSGASGLMYLSGTVTTVGARSGCPSLEGQVHLSGIRTFDIANTPCNPDLSVSASISGPGGITKTGAGALGLSASNSFGGVLTVSEGSVQLHHDNALGATSGATLVQNGASLHLFAVSVPSEPLTLQGYGPSGGAALNASEGANAWSGAITLDAGTRVFTETNAVLDLSGVVAGNGGIVKTGPGRLILSGAEGNGNDDDTYVMEGVLEMGKTSGYAVPMTLHVGAASGPERSVMARHLRSTQCDAVIVEASGLYDLNGQNETLGWLTLNGGGDVQTGAGILTLGAVSTLIVGPGTNMNASARITGKLNVGSGTRQLQIGQGRYDRSNLSDLVVDAAVSGSADILKQGTGELELGSSNTFTGTLTIEAGGVRLADAWGLGSASGGTRVNSGAYLQLHGPSIHVGTEALSLSGAGIHADWGALYSTFVGSNSWDGDIDLAADSVVGVEYAVSILNLSGAIGGSGGLTKVNDGTLILSGNLANTYAGTTFVNQGVLALAEAATDRTIPGNLVVGDGAGGAGADVVRLMRDNQIANIANVTIASSGLLDLNNSYDRISALTGSGAVSLGSGYLVAGHSDSSFTFDGLVSGTGYLWKVGAGRWTLTGNNTYTGTTRIETGTLLVNGEQPASDMAIQSHGLLGGIGIVGRVTSTGGMLSPGLSPGTLTSSNVLFDSATDFRIELTDAGSDQLNVRGKVGLANAALVLSAPGLLPAEGERFLIVNNDDADAVTGTFAGLSEGAIVSAGSRQFLITYKGGSGNDVVLVATNTAALRPTLTIWQTPSNTVVVSWPQSDIAWLLHATTNLGGSPIRWTELLPPYLSNATRCLIVEPAPAGQRFYRLHHP